MDMPDSTCVRRFRWADLDALAPVFDAVTGADAGMLRGLLSQPARDAERDCLVAGRDGAIVGFALVASEAPIRRAVISGGVLEAHRGRGVGRALLRAALERAGEVGAAVAHVQVPETADAAVRLLESEGFVPVRRYLDLAWDGDAASPPEIGPGYRVRRFRGGDEPALTELQNACFDGSWGFCPNTVEDIAYRTAANPGVVFIDRGSRPVAYAWTALDGATGWIQMTGVHPGYRGRGLGKAVLLAGMTDLAENGAKTVRLEADDLNAAAKAIYFSAGFRVVGRSVWYERPRVASSVDPST